MAGQRLTGLISGMDTESLISQLVESRKTKVTNKKKEQISLNYKQDKWKELNTKLKNLQAKFVGTMRFSSAYQKKTTAVSNTSAVSVITGENAVEGVQRLEVKHLAKTAYLTGAQLKGGSGDLTAMSKMSDLGFEGSGSFTVNTGTSKVDVSIDENTTISDVLTKLKSAGLNANFDAKNQRFFVSAKESGTKNDFSITASGTNGDAALEALGLKVSLKDDAATLKKYQDLAKLKGADDAATKANMKSMIDAEIASREAEYQKQYTNLMTKKEAAQKTIADINEKLDGKVLLSSDEYASQIEALEKKIKDKDFADGETEESLKEQLKGLNEDKASALTIEKNELTISSADEEMAKILEKVDIASSEQDGKTVYTATAKSDFADEIAQSFVDKANYAASVVADYDPAAAAATGATKVNAEDATIILNGAEFTNNTNVFEINGLTFTALNETKDGEAVTVTTQTDVSGVYDMVKNFLKEYNSVINEIDKLYNAESTGTMKPMTSEEKDAVSETEASDWEKKLRDSSLRRDSNLGTIAAALKEAMTSRFEINGKQVGLLDFGIENLSYFLAPENEKNAYHIAGDPDDEHTSGNADKLKSLIASDPDMVVSYFTKLSQTLYSKMSDLSKSVEGYRSFGNFYDDKRMKTDYNDYNTKIAELEKKLNDYEDKWYSKFAKMESAMAKMQKNTSAVTALLGGGY